MAALPMPKQVPALGFYYHYKHNPDGEVNNYAYEVVGVGFHTEDNTRPGEEHFVMYRPLYESSVYLAAQKLGIPCFDNRPLEMWMGEVEVIGVIRPRFMRIADTETCRALEQIRARMYL